jgi:hypothetical protein
LCHLARSCTDGVRDRWHLLRIVPAGRTDAASWHYPGFFFGRAEKEPGCPCAVPRRRSSVGAIPTRQLLLQPVAIGAVVEVTILPKPSMQRVASGDSASRQARTRVNAEQASKRFYCGSRPSGHLGKAAVVEIKGATRSLRRSRRGSGAGMAAQGERTQHGRPQRWQDRLPTGRPRGTGPAVWGVGQAHSTVEAG